MRQLELSEVKHSEEGDVRFISFGIVIPKKPQGQKAGEVGKCFSRSFVILLRPFTFLCIGALGTGALKPMG